MARCEEISLLLGPFEDGELEPHEMQEVARHLVGCTECDGELADYRSLGLSLRSTAAIPALECFANAVVERITELHVPLGLRIRRFLGSLAEGIGATIAPGVATAAIAVVIAVVITPYARALLSHAPASAPHTVARAQPPIPSPMIAKAASPAPEKITPAIAAAPAPPDIDLADANDLLSLDSGSDQPGNTVISKLEADSPSVAVWSEPRTDTTVIWVPDLPH